ncbi:DegT/DnrJ/EryC1/StrS family aminotransferase [Chelativorans salis]|uniref:DegT/DnrJ/EryC1/StrS aminotransferase family protein n=1 Tax=Chelativorans salis TaxID=2978478 RepID=A0ABT2LQT7_9HYPH|nr:DegT/DnrJ/EryC1/StrS aminotransferase family protein [Chelativorans sp. EGI FJ00035]MCT7376920.1 DegT/DnrJ/EryC1/StrS aminotransferase family protein [Chelativorans sp. EGI FJ00035]
MMDNNLAAKRVQARKFGAGAGQPVRDPAVGNRWPHYDEEQIEDVVAVLRSGKVNAWTGGKVAEFEAAYAALLGRRHAIALANGTVALDVALHAIGLQPGEEVIVTPRSFVASAACVPMAGGVPVFADVDPECQAITASSIAAVLTPRTRAIIVVHLAGWPADMPPIMRLARKHGIVVIEDCAQAHGAAYAGHPVGSFGDLSAFSFCQDKILSTGGEGGLLAMDDEAIWNRAWSRKDHGKAYEAVIHRGHAPGFRWLHESFGSNYRMTEVQAAIGLRQLNRLPEWQSRRAANAAILIDALHDLPGLRTPQPPPHIRHAWYRFYTFVRPERLKNGWNRDRILSALNVSGVACFTGSCPEIYREKAFMDSGMAPPERLPISAALGETSLAFLVDPCQSPAAMRKAAGIMRKVMQTATADVVPGIAQRRAALAW